MRASFDFFYCPWNPYKRRNCGYLIINFFDHEGAVAFMLQWGKVDMMTGQASSDGLDIQPAILQGRAACLDHFSSFILAQHKDMRFRPLIRADCNAPLRAMSVAPEMVQDFQEGVSSDQ
jgi:hypothetical protein